jgi:sphingolipid delta-4 desaturase
MAPASPKGGPTDYVAAPVNTVHFEVTTPQPHYARRKALEAAHPELKELAEKRPDTILYVLFAVAAQVGIAWYLRSISASWYVVIGAAFAVGAVMDHLLWVLIHDLTHDSSFDNPIWNKMAACFANIPIIFPAAISFRYYHRLHHSQLNIAWTDPDMPGPTEIGIFGSSFLGKATWMLFFAAIQVRFLPSLRPAPFLRASGFHFFTTHQLTSPLSHSLVIKFPPCRHCAPCVTTLSSAAMSPGLPSTGSPR